ncbi:MAG: glutamate---cysteine ligase / carboxylate-amine ligase [Candidatus Sumerlaeota bacterium]|nr:glutamate---cysteine ligase / carboxylate-amine ligase [Candidatus Sumerlaeota bacterium]
MSDNLHLFAGTGVELEYMIVGKETLDVLPVCDKLMEAQAGSPVSEIDIGDLSWSNELALHVVELKTNGPAATLDGLGAKFQQDIDKIGALLAPLGGRLMPAAMHPWMDPLTQTQIWPHEYSPVYHAYDRIFGCKGHGWSNVQSVHINLPFSGDEEFGRLHAAIRLVLPLLPALAASSPVLENKKTGFLDTRLRHYAMNQKRIPSVTGSVIPEGVFTEADYNERIFKVIDRDIAPHDPDKILSHFFLNSRGAIARFDRGAIEIRLLDLQECPEADLAIVALVVAVVRALVEERWSSYADQKNANTPALIQLLNETVKRGEEAIVPDAHYLKLFGMDLAWDATAEEVWNHLAQSVEVADEHQDALWVMLHEGPLARRILAALPENPQPKHIRTVYERLCACLADGELFVAPSG